MYLNVEVKRSGLYSALSVTSLFGLEHSMFARKRKVKRRAKKLKSTCPAIRA